MISVLIFLLAIHLATRTVAACYGVVDHWYHIRLTWFHVLFRVAIWTAVPLALYLALPTIYRSSLLWGYACFGLFHVLIYWFGQFIRRRVENGMSDGS